jgi:hypothetical protein
MLGCVQRYSGDGCELKVGVGDIVRVICGQWQIAVLYRGVKES